MIAKITKCDHSGDSVLAEFDTDVEESVSIAQEALTEFMTGCVTDYGEEPPVWAKRIGEANFGKFDPKEMQTYEEVLVHAPIVGG
jgi:hypothetical protein